MDYKILLEIFGYIGSTLVVISMLMTSVMKLRIINTCGSVIAAIYALITGTYPIFIMNVALIVINLINMRKLSHTSSDYRIVKATGSDPLVMDMISKYAADIRHYFPDFNDTRDDSLTFVVINGDTPVGITSGTQDDNGVFNIHLDYSTPAYRDCSVGTYLYNHLKSFGLSKVLLSKASSEHLGYLRKVGFSEEDGSFVRML